MTAERGCSKHQFLRDAGTLRRDTRDFVADTFRCPGHPVSRERFLGGGGGGVPRSSIGVRRESSRNSKGFILGSLWGYLGVLWVFPWGLLRESTAIC